MTDDLMYQENTELCSQINDVEEEVSSKVAELEEKLNCVLWKSNLHVTNEISFLNASMIFSPTLFARKRTILKFVDGVCQCCVELLSMNVATTQVEPVICSVLLNVAGIEVGAQPKSSTLSNVLTEMKCLVYEKLSDELIAEDNITLHSDGASQVWLTLRILSVINRI